MATETTIKPSTSNPNAIVLERRSFYEAELDNFSKAPAQDVDSFTTLTNVEPVVDGRLQRRRGYTQFHVDDPLVAARRIFEAHFASGANRFILAASDFSGASGVNNRITSFNESGNRGHATNNILVPTVNATAASQRQPSIVTSRQYSYIADGGSTQVFKRWDGVDDPSTANSVVDWGLSASGNTFTAATGAGAITVEVGRRYLVAFLYANNSENLAVLYDISSSGTDEEKASDSVNSGPLTANDVDLSSLPTYTIGTSGFVAANMYRVILATSDGGPLDTLYEIGRITDNTTTTFTDNMTEEALLASPVWAEITEDGREVGIYDNTRPSVTIPAASIITAHRGRLWAINEQFLFWSKDLADLTTSSNIVAGRYEACWPASNQVPLAIQAEFGRGLLSDGIRLYIATDRGIRVLDGNPPNINGPRTLFHEVGLMRQDTWQIVSHSGQMLGSIWLTPDRRVIFSNFNTYEDIGWGIQDTLNDITVSTARAKASASFFSDGPYELYLLAIPAPGSSSECETICVYNIKSKHWVIWTPTDVIYAQAFMQDITNNRPLPIFSTIAGGAGKLYRWITGAEYETAANLQDRVGGTPVTYAVTMKTSWMDYNLPEMAKMLNKIEVFTGDSALTIAIEGANNEAGFSSPTTVLSTTTVDSTGPYDQYRISNLAAKFSKHKFYRITIASPAGTSRELLSFMALECVPTHDF